MPLHIFCNSLTQLVLLFFSVSRKGPIMFTSDFFHRCGDKVLLRWSLFWHVTLFVAVTYPTHFALANNVTLIPRPAKSLLQFDKHFLYT